MLTRAFLGLTGLLFLAFAAVSFLNPIGMAASLGVEVSGPNGAYELRGIYGGVSLGAGLLCLGGVLRAGLRAPALWFLVTYMGGYIFARAAALLMGPAPTSAYTGFIAFEAAVLFGAALCLFARRNN
ncbi:DUF4345 family protein [Hyphomonas sp.]|uniref:DUF4345 family protein n=1 Tax=Hyphomonas sp. TaxID=87 RepID=UPI00391D25D7